MLTQAAPPAVPQADQQAVPQKSTGVDWKSVGMGALGAGALVGGGLLARRGLRGPRGVPKPGVPAHAPAPAPAPAPSSKPGSTILTHIPRPTANPTMVGGQGQAAGYEHASAPLKQMIEGSDLVKSGVPPHIAHQLAQWSKKPGEDVGETVFRHTRPTPIGAGTMGHSTVDAATRLEKAAMVQQAAFFDELTKISKGGENIAAMLARRIGQEGVKGAPTQAQSLLQGGHARGRDVLNAVRKQFPAGVKTADAAAPMPVTWGRAAKHGLPELIPGITAGIGGMIAAKYDKPVSAGAALGGAVGAIPFLLAGKY